MPECCDVVPPTPPPMSGRQGFRTSRMMSSSHPFSARRNMATCPSPPAMSPVRDGAVRPSAAVRPRATRRPAAVRHIVLSSATSGVAVEERRPIVFHAPAEVLGEGRCCRTLKARAHRAVAPFAYCIVAVVPVVVHIIACRTQNNSDMSVPPAPRRWPWFRRPRTSRGPGRRRRRRTCAARQRRCDSATVSVSWLKAARSIRRPRDARGVPGRADVLVKGRCRPCCNIRLSPRNKYDMSVTPPVSHVEMWPYVVSAAPASESHAATAVFRCRRPWSECLRTSRQPNRRRTTSTRTGAVERVVQVHVVVHAPAEVLVEGRGAVEHPAHVRDARGVPRRCPR